MRSSIVGWLALALLGCRAEHAAPASAEAPIATPIRGFAPVLRAPGAEGGATSPVSAPRAVATGSAPAAPMPSDATIEAAVSALQSLLLQLPEKRATDERSAPSHVAFFPADGGASDCAFDDRTCALSFQGQFIGGGGGGRWASFRKKDLGTGPLEVHDRNALGWIPYEQWRQDERSDAPGQPARDPRAQLPVRKAGDGPFGYGSPTHGVEGSAFRHPTAKVLSAAGIVVERVDYFATPATKAGARGTYPVLTVVSADVRGVPARAIAALASRLVAANGGFPIELAVPSSGARFQVDHVPTKAWDTANVYALGPLGFEPVPMR